MDCVTFGWHQDPTSPGDGLSQHHTYVGVYIGNAPWRESDLSTWSGAWIKDVLSRSRSLQANRCSHLSSSFLACSCSAPGHSARPWRFIASRIHPICEPWANPPEASIGKTTRGTWSEGVTLPTTALAGTSMGQALRFLRQIGTLEDPGCNST